MVYYIPWTGGFGDRLRGVIVSYYLAALTGRRLLIKNPIRNASLIQIKSNYEIPDSWDVPSHLTKHHHNTWLGDQDLLMKENFIQLACVDVIQFHSNRGNLTQLFIHPEFQATPAMDWILQLKERGLLWHTPLTTIMKPGEKIRQLLGRIREDHFNGQFYKVAVHLRISDDFMLAQNLTTSNTMRISTTSVRLFPLQVQSIWNSLPNKEKYSDGMKVFVTADTPKFAAEVQEALTSMKISWFDTTPYAGTPVHVQYNGEQTRTMLDWWLFTEMDFIVATRSGYSETAAKYSCKGFSVFCPNIYEPERFLTYPSPGLCQPMDFDLNPYWCPPD